MTAIVAPGERDHVDLIAVRSQVIDQPAVIKITAGEGLQVAIDDQPNVHQRSCRYAAHALSSSHSLIVMALRFGDAMRLERLWQKIRAKCSRLGFNPVNSCRSFNVRLRK